MMFRSVRLILIGFMLVLSIPSFAVTLETAPVRYFNIRHMAMGGAGVALLQGAETAYTNPAGIVEAGTHFNFPLIPVGLTNATILASTDLTETGYDLINAVQTTDSDQIKADKLFKKLIPRTYILGSSIPIGYSGESPWPSFGSHMAISGYYAMYGNFALLNPVSPFLQFKFYQDTVLGISFARSIEDIDRIVPQFRDVKVGYTIKRINRRSSYDIDRDNEQEKITLTDVINQDIKAGYAETTGWSADIGFMGRADTIIGNGHWGLTCYNIGGNLDGVSYLMTSKDVEAGMGDVHLKVPVTATLGWAVENQFMKFITNGFFDRPTIMAVDYDLVYPTQSFAKRFHCGLEQPLADWFSIQLGINQGFGTGGIQFLWPFYRFSVAYYTEELGNEVGINPKNYWLANAGLLF